MPLAIIEEKKGYGYHGNKEIFAEHCTHIHKALQLYTHFHPVCIPNHPPSTRPVEGVKKVLLHDLRPWMHCYTMPVLVREEKVTE